MIKQIDTKKKQSLSNIENQKDKKRVKSYFYIKHTQNVSPKKKVVFQFLQTF